MKLATTALARASVSSIKRKLRFHSYSYSQLCSHFPSFSQVRPRISCPLPSYVTPAASRCYGSSANKTSSQLKKYRKDYSPPAYRISEVNLKFQIFSDRTDVYSKLSVERASGTPANTPLVLNGEQLSVKQIMVDGKDLLPQEYSYSDDLLTLPSPPSTQSFCFESVVSINPETNTALRGLYRTGKHAYTTQCEAEGFRCITFMIDRPDVMARYPQVYIEAEKSVFLSFSPTATRFLKEWPQKTRHFTVWQDPFPKPSYLFAVVAGDFGVLEDTFVTKSGRSVALRIYSERSYVSQLNFAMQSLKQAMKWDEDTYGLEYDLDLYNIVAVRDFVMGAMENKSLNVFATMLVLAKPEITTDLEYERIQGVIGHEYFHNWTGNRVTCRDWFQLTLKEGLTVFRDQEFSSDVTNSPVKRIETVRSLRNSQFQEDAGPLSHPIRPESYIIMDNFYTSTVYSKGAEVIRMYQILLGKKGFRKGMDLYIGSYDGQAVTCDDFRGAMARANGADLRQFELWYSTSGTPVVEVEGSYTHLEKRYTLHIKQHTPSTADQPGPKPALHIPIIVGLLSKRDGKELVPSTLLELKSFDETFTFDSVKEEPVPSVLRGFSAPVKLRLFQSDEDLALLMAHDTDAFNSWDAGQRLYARVITQFMEQLVTNNGNVEDLPPLPLVFTNAVKVLLTSRTMERSFQAYALIMPTVDTLMNELPSPVNIDALYQSIMFIYRSLATTFYAELISLYHDLAPSSSSTEDLENVADMVSIGRRRLRGVALRYLSSLKSPEVGALCWSQYRSATCMTEKMQAITNLADIQGPGYQQVLEQFYLAAAGDEGVIDKRFRIQAMADHPDVISQVRALMKHKDFNLANPPRMRSLIAAFVVGNPVRFHAADGSGYQLLGEVIPQVDQLNPQVSSSLISYLSNYRKFDSSRIQRMRQQLERISALPKLSPNAREMVDRILSVK